MGKGAQVVRAALAVALVAVATPRMVHAQLADAVATADTLDTRVVCTLHNGDRIGGTLERASRTTIRVRDAVLGHVRLPRASVARCESSDAATRARIGALALAPFDPATMVAITSSSPAVPAPRIALALPRPLPPERIKHARPATPLGARALPTYASTVGWKRTIGTSYALSRGNANTSDLGFTGGVTRRAARSQVALTARRRFTSADGQQSADYFSATLRYDLATGPNDAAANRRPSFFSETVYEHDPFAKVVRRTVSNIGFSVPLSTDSTNNLALEIGGGVTHELPEGGASPYTHVGGLLRLAARQHFGTTHADQQFAAFPDLSGPTGHYRLNSDFNISAPITHRVSLKVGVQNRYDTHPQAAVRKADTTVQSGLAVEF